MTDSAIKASGAALWDQRSFFFSGGVEQLQGLDLFSSPINNRGFEKGRKTVVLRKQSAAVFKRLLTTSSHHHCFIVLFVGELSL